VRPVGACAGDEAAGGDERPDALEQQEAPLPLVPGEHRQDPGADDVDEQVRRGARVEHAELGEGEARKHEQCAGDLDELVHRSSCASSSGPGTARVSSGVGRNWPPPFQASTAGSAGTAG
jgi:hypothetical protein